MRIALLPSALLALAATAAHADTLVATLGEPLVEVAHEVEITVDGGVARYRVERVFANRGGRADEASLDIDLPAGGGVTGLRIRARDTWYDGDLMEAQAAAKLYHELTGMGPFPAKDPALLQWVWPDKVHLQVFPVLPGGRSTVAYTITVPTKYRAGAYLLSYPRFPGPGLVQPRLMVRSKGARGTVTIDGVKVADGERYTVPGPPAEGAAGSGWDGGVERMPGASYVFSPIVIAESERARAPIRSATVDVTLAHTYRGDLRVELVSPRGQVVVVHDRQGGGDNDVKLHVPVALGPDTPAAGRWRLVVSDHAARDVGTLDRWSLTLDTGQGAPIVAAAAAGAGDVPLFIPDAPEGADDRGLLAIAVPAPPIDTVAARLGRVVASERHGFLRLEVDAAPTLRPLPRAPSVVFVLDASHSEGPRGIAEQLAIARAYLAHVPDARFEIIAFRRRASRVIGGFRPAADFDAITAAGLSDGRLGPGNGSALEVGLEAALAALRDARAPRRIVVLTDAMLRSDFPAAQARLIAALPRGLGPDTVVHVVLPEPGGADEVTEVRDDDHALAPIAAAGRGILVRLGVGTLDPKRLGPAVLGLVRPIRIDGFRVVTDGGRELEDCGAPATLDEGAAVRAMVAAASRPRRVVLQGKVWAEPLRREVSIDEKFSKHAAAFVFGEDRHGDLDEREQMAVALYGQVVSPVTSYLAAEPGVRPSPIGIVREAMGVGFGAGGLGMRGMGMGGGGGLPLRPDLAADVASQVSRCLAAHPPAGPIELDVETTLDEVVDVGITSGRGPAATCIAEAIWAHRLDERYRQFTRERFELRFASR